MNSELIVLYWKQYKVIKSLLLTLINEVKITKNNNKHDIFQVFWLMVSICARKRTIIFSKWYAKFQKSDWQLHLFIRTGAAFPIQSRMKWNTNVVLFIPYGKLFLTDDFDSVIADGPISSKYQTLPLAESVIIGSFSQMRATAKLE